MFKDILFAGGGWLIGCFTPAVGRVVKAYFVKESKAVVADAKAEVTAAAKKL